MTKTSLPLKRPDGSVIVQPLQPTRPTFEQVASLPFHSGRRSAVDHGVVQHAKIFRDIAILALLAITILAGSAVLIATIWQDVVIAENEARIVIAEQEAIAKLAEVEMTLNAESEAKGKMVVFALAGFGIAIIILALTRPSVVIGR